MQPYQATQDDDLSEIIDQKLTALIREMEEADWSMDEVVLAIEDILRNRWLNRIRSLQNTRDVVSKDFVSDGNEG